ncbi:MAG: hypothetical protein SGI88_13920 [Candidatus Hydrogenedentes bacterium]|nr:hypothetical protein [Candidatus Hydrogenedentota bacterium]
MIIGKDEQLVRYLSWFWCGVLILSGAASSWMMGSMIPLGIVAGILALCVVAAAIAIGPLMVVAYISGKRKGGSKSG